MIVFDFVFFIIIVVCFLCENICCYFISRFCCWFLIMCSFYFVLVYLLDDYVIVCNYKKL